MLSQLGAAAQTIDAGTIEKSPGRRISVFRDPTMTRTLALLLLLRLGFSVRGHAAPPEPALFDAPVWSEAVRGRPEAAATRRLIPAKR